MTDDVLAACAGCATDADVELPVADPGRLRKSDRRASRAASSLQFRWQGSSLSRFTSPSAVCATATESSPENAPSPRATIASRLAAALS